MATTVAIAIFLGQEHGHTQRPTSRDNRYLVDRIVLRHESADNGVACLVKSGVALFRFRHHHRPPLGAHHDFVFRQLKLIHSHQSQPTPSGKQRRLIH